MIGSRIDPTIGIVSLVKLYKGEETRLSWLWAILICLKQGCSPQGFSPQGCSPLGSRHKSLASRMLSQESCRKDLASRVFTSRISTARMFASRLFSSRILASITLRQGSLLKDVAMLRLENGLEGSQESLPAMTLRCLSQ